MDASRIATYLMLVLFVLATTCYTYPTCPADKSCKADPIVDPPSCSGYPGGWPDGCRGTGCFVCAEKVKDYPFYFQHHPDCVLNNFCYGVYGLCNPACPKPTNNEKYPPLCPVNKSCKADPKVDPPACSGYRGGWPDGCRGTGCTVCVEKVRSYPYYFHRHPRCVPNNNCFGQYGLCNPACPKPTDADKKPPQCPADKSCKADPKVDPPSCSGYPGGWADGCRGTGCFVCIEKLKNHPYYLHHHPYCVPNKNCFGKYGLCNPACPKPTEKEKKPPQCPADKSCKADPRVDPPACSGYPGGWPDGCRGTGCSVCIEKLRSYPYYLKHHPNCVPNKSCKGVYGLCNPACPKPTNSDKHP